MPDPKTPTSAEKLTMLRAIAQQRLAAGEPPSQQVQVALSSFQTAPTPEEIQRVAGDILRSGNPAGALEFEVYASQLAAPQNAEREEAQRQFDAGAAPSPAVQQALASFKEPPTPEQIQTLGNYLRATHGEAVGQQFETYAASAVAQQAGAQAYRPPPHPIRPVPSDFQGEPQPAPAPQPRQQPQVMQAGMVGESRLLARAKDVLQGTGHILTLGAIPAPESIKSGNERLMEGLGVKKPPRQGKTEAEQPRDKNKERDLLNEAKRIDADPR